jgi:hypothetical protein
MNSAAVLTNSTAAIETQTIWVWDQSANGGTGGYEVKVTVDDFKVAPGQGFFVRANTTTNLNFTKTNQTTSSDTFQKTAKTEISLLKKIP